MLPWILLLLVTLQGPTASPAQEGQDSPPDVAGEQEENPCPFLTSTGWNSGFGFALAGGGDVNGDGTPDFAVGSPWFGRGGPYTGRVEVFSGKDASVLHTFLGYSQRSLLGFSVCIPGDLDGDGKADIVAGAPLACRVYVWSGADGSLLRVIEGEDAVGSSWLGASIAVLEDLDDDGVTDLAIGAPRQKITLIEMGRSRSPVPYIVGRVHLVSGKTGETIRTLGTRFADFYDPDVFTTRFARSFGRSLEAVGDFDGDGVSDLAVGAPGEPVLWFYGRSFCYLPTLTRRADHFHRPYPLHWELTHEYDEWCQRGRGQAYIFSGRDGSLLLTLEGGGDANGYGCDLAAVGDVDKDGKGDLAVGAYRETSESGNQGAVRIHSGADGKELVLVRGRVPDSELGYSLTAAGDVDGDGVGDLWTSDPIWNHQNQVFGEVYLISGRDGSVLRTIHEWGRDGLADFGIDLNTIDDLDGDGARDLLVGTPDTYWEGCVGVYSARSGKLLLEIVRTDEEPAGAPPRDQPR